LKNKITHKNNFGNELRQLQAETESWKQLLSSRMEENVLLKNSLAHILKNNFDKSSLEDIEDFQTEFIEQDEWIKSLKKDVITLEKIFEDDEMEGSLEMRVEKFRRNLASSSKKFSYLKSAFNDFQHKISTRVNIEK
jgi:regulator of replication initiation timing